jgi:hypothetical protein
MVSVAAIIAVGVNSDGRGKVLGMDIGPPEAEIFWTGFPGKLARSVCVKRVITDAHEGIRQRWLRAPSCVSSEPPRSSRTRNGRSNGPDR